MNILMRGWVYDAGEIDTGDVRYLSITELRKLADARRSAVRPEVAQAAQRELNRRTIARRG